MNWFNLLVLVTLVVICGAESASFVQITDVHIDPLYEIGSPANCTDITECCHADSVPVGPEVAGPEGSYHCDTPPWLANTTITFAGTLNPKWVLYTGDAPDHDMIEQTKEGNLWAIKQTALYLRSSFPTQPIYPVLGNHDSFPMDQVPAPPQSNWLFEAIMEDYKEYLPASAHKTFLYGGYYSVLTPDGHRLIALNTDYFDMINAYVFTQQCTEVRKAQLNWLDMELEAARKLNEPVIIASHIPPGHFSSTVDYISAMLRVTAEYRDIIRAVIHGHTHIAKLRIFHEDDVSDVPTAVSFIAPSMTSYGYINPSVRVFHYDTTSGEILDLDQYSCDLGRANAEKRPCQFAKMYSYKSEYGLPDFKPASFRSLWDRLHSDAGLMATYWRNQCTDYPFIRPCDAACQHYVLCQMRFVSPQRMEHCIAEHTPVGGYPEAATMSRFSAEVAKQRQEQREKLGLSTDVGYTDPDYCV